MWCTRYIGIAKCLAARGWLEQAKTYAEQAVKVLRVCFGNDDSYLRPSRELVEEVSEMLDRAVQEFVSKGMDQAANQGKAGVGRTRGRILTH